MRGCAPTAGAAEPPGLSPPARRQKVQIQCWCVGPKEEAYDSWLGVTVGGGGRRESQVERVVILSRSLVLCVNVDCKEY